VKAAIHYEDRVHSSDFAGIGHCVHDSGVGAAESTPGLALYVATTAESSSRGRTFPRPPPRSALSAFPSQTQFVWGFPQEMQGIVKQGVRGSRRHDPNSGLSSRSRSGTASRVRRSSEWLDIARSAEGGRCSTSLMPLAADDFPRKAGSPPWWVHVPWRGSWLDIRQLHTTRCGHYEMPLARKTRNRRVPSGFCPAVRLTTGRKPMFG